MNAKGVIVLFRLSILKLKGYYSLACHFDANIANLVLLRK